MTEMNEIEREFFSGRFIDPTLAVPQHGEIIVIACQLPAGQDIMLTAVYEQRDDGREAWNCGAPFETLYGWYGLGLFDDTAQTCQEKLPLNGEIVVISCITERGERVFQTALCERIGEESVVFNCGTPYEKLEKWMSLPQVDKKKIINLKTGIIQ